MQRPSSPQPDFGELLAHAEFLRNLARQLCATDAHGAEDLAQDVWVAALERPPPGRGRMSSWLAAVALNLRFSKLRRPSKHQDLDQHGLPQRGPSDELERAALSEARRTVALAVQSLRNPYREILLLRFWEDLDLKEVARRVDRPLETVRTQLKRALAELRAELSSEREEDEVASLLLLVARPRSERPMAPAPSTWAAPTAAAGIALVGALGWLAATRAEEAPLELAAAREVGLPSAALEAPRTAVDPTDRVAVAADRTEPVGTSESSSAPGPADPAPATEFIVVDQQGAPVGDAEVHALTAQGWVERGRTDASGRVSIALREGERDVLVAEPGAAWVRATGPGRATIEETMFLPAATRTSPLALRVGGDEAVLSARVVDPDGFAIDGVDVVFIPAGLPTGFTEQGAVRRVARLETRTDDEGHFELDRLPVGDGWVHVRHPDLGIATTSVSLEADPSEREIVFIPGAIVHGVVSDDRGFPLAGAFVRATWRRPFSLPDAWTSIRTAADGSYSFALPAVAGLELWVGLSADKRLQLLEQRQLASGAHVEWNPRLRAWDPIRVRLVDRSGAPVEGWLVTLRAARGSLLEPAGVTDAEGRTSLVMALEGKAQLLAMGPYWGERNVPRAVVDGVEPHPTREWTLVVDGDRSGVGGLKGRLVPVGWTPPADLQVAIVRDEDEGSGRAPIDRDLRFQVTGLTPGSYGIALISGPRMLGFVAHHQVLADGSLDLGEIEVPAPATLDLSKLPARTTYELLAVRADGSRRSCGGVDGGSSAAALLLPGAFALRAHVAGDAPSSPELRFEASAGELVHVTADLTIED
jgi:RNA polymerase sigma factor (sigma-70 family)